MAMMKTDSELLETELTPVEENLAMQMMDKNLSYAYLQNSRVNIFRILASQEFDKPEEDHKNQRIRAYYKGQLDLLETLCYGILNPTPVPLEQQSQGGNSFNQGA